MDNYYSNPKLLLSYSQQNMFATGTVHQICKEFPKSLKSNNKLEVGQNRFARCGELLAVFGMTTRM